jgi:alpha-tubulin suppressor-like RCC1 family protein
MSGSRHSLLRGTGMRTRAKWLVLGGIATMSVALVHCVGDDPPAVSGGGADAGGDNDLIGETSIGPDTSTVTDAGLDGSSICTSNADVTCGTGVSPCIIQISGGGQNFCARDNQCKVYCWGDNRDGQLGTPPTTIRNSAKPLAVSFGGKLAAGVDIAGPDGLTSFGYTVACARVTATPGTPTTVECWGADEYGQIAIDPNDGGGVSVDDGGKRYVPTPTEIPGVSAATLLGVGETHECALTSANALECWGDNTYGELARDTGGVNTNPVPGQATFAGGGSPALDAITIGYQHMCTTNGTAGANDRVACVGDDMFDQLGRDGGPNSSTLTAVVPMTNADSIAASKFTTCAINKGGAVVCWGYNGLAETGNGAVLPAVVGNPTPAIAPLAGGIPVVGLTAGTHHFCALLKVPDPGDGGVAQNVYCWGDNDFGEAAPGNVTSPILVAAPVAGLPARAAAIAAGSQASCALINDGTVYCWGENYVGELGNGDPGDGGVSGPVKVTF